MRTTRKLGFQPGVQLEPLLDGTGGIDPGPPDQVFAVVARLTRGRVDRPFLVTRGSFYQKTGPAASSRLSPLNEAKMQAFEGLNASASAAVVSRLVPATAQKRYVSVNFGAIGSPPIGAVLALQGDALSATDLTGKTLVYDDFLSSPSGGFIEFPGDVGRIGVGPGDLGSFAFGTGPFSVEANVKMTMPGFTGGSSPILFSIGDYGGLSGVFAEVYELSGDARLLIGAWESGIAVLTGIDVLCSSVGFLSGVRTHIALCRDNGGVLRLFVGGVEAGSATWTQNIEIPNNVSIGCLVGSAVYQFGGDMDHILITNTARYTEQFTPPTGFSI